MALHANARNCVENYLMTVFAAAGLILAGQPVAHAGNRAPLKPPTTTTTSAAITTAAQSNQDSGKYDRKCVMMSCGTPWCFNTRR